MLIFVALQVLGPGM